MADKTNAFKLEIITPDEVFFSGEAFFLEFTSIEGDMGVYKEHIPLTTILQPCAMNIHQDAGEKKCAVLGGFVEIQKKKITVLAEDAQWPDEIDVARAEQAAQRAEERIAKNENTIDVKRAEAALKRAMARLDATK